MAKQHDVTIQGMQYRPNPLVVEAGDSVVWTNKDNMTHTATSKDGLFDTGPLTLNQSSSAMTISEVSPESGWGYFCDFHVNMAGAIIAKEAAGTTTPVVPTIQDRVEFWQNFKSWALQNGAPEVASAFAKIDELFSMWQASLEEGANVDPVS